jgi:UPF0755 protein
MKRAVLVSLASVCAWALWAFALPVSNSDSRVISIGVGQGASSISRTLRQAGVVHSALAFRLAARFSGDQSDLKAGDYEIPAGLNVFQTLDLIVSGKTLVHRFLVREGLSAKQIAALVEQAGLGHADAFMAVINDPAMVRELGVSGPSLEGYLFPDTYQVAKGMDEKALAKLMVARFKQKVPDSLLAQGAAIRLSPQQVLTMASIIEKEAKADKERPLVSAVFRNRMRLKKRLESCATVRYALDKWTGPLYNKDLLRPSPYNTYQNFGLPPGPICSPGLASIEGALHPAVTDALYFVVAGDGTHIFSKTYEQHLAAVARYKRLKKGIADDQ